MSAKKRNIQPDKRAVRTDQPKVPKSIDSLIDSFMNGEDKKNFDKRFQHSRKKTASRKRASSKARQ